MSAASLAYEVFPDVPLRQWVISFPFPLRYLFAAHPQAMAKVLGVVCRPPARPKGVHDPHHPATG